MVVVEVSTGGLGWFMLTVVSLVVEVVVEVVVVLVEVSVVVAGLKNDSSSLDPLRLSSMV